ncbi:F0F1 ATP synthase subunit A [Capnocytophaga catalasegens]|uniref:ATP synthase subunit a n=1 Tax=Capnocytophaga catalasegens TaxID=1004260 RepID=A0AAV5AXK5_9FLAO|nr:ATP synthase subunit a [Capnocytophaga catalasegens]GJM50525.1 ATP synthase subunit a [Capnocytophaga catalasegens]GJM53204.1 ATP synthase subunit a [Capnocytophaga catalasegens]
MMIQKIVDKIAFLLLLCGSLSVFSQQEDHHQAPKENKVDGTTEMIMHHIADAHDYHIMDWKGHAISVSLPIILWTENGLVTFMSSKFHHDDSGKVIVESKGLKFVKYHGEIFYANADGSLSFDEKHHVTNLRPLNFSITKNVVTLIFVCLLMLFIFVSVAKSYKKNDKAPKGVAGFLEPLILFIRDDIAKPNIGDHKYERYMPYLLTVFFLIWIGNLLGLVPVISGTLTNDILFTGTLAVLTFVITVFSGNKNYWKHIFATPGVPIWLLPIMIPVEILGMLTKPFALMVRLFANITAGHIVILSLISLIFVFKSVYASVVSVPFGLFINVLELLVAFIQAYVFTLLSALFIGQAVEEEHH